MRKNRINKYVCANCDIFEKKLQFFFDTVFIFLYLYPAIDEFQLLRLAARRKNGHSRNGQASGKWLLLMKLVNNVEPICCGMKEK